MVQSRQHHLPSYKLHFDHLHTITVLRPLTLKTISTASTRLILQLTSTASTCFILQLLLRLIQPVETILHRFSKLHCELKIGTLAVKLAKVSIFGDQVLLKCTVMGECELPGLPAEELLELKQILFHLFPKLWGSRHEFEPLWRCTA